MNEILAINKGVKNWAGHIETDGLVFFLHASELPDWSRLYWKKCLTAQIPFLRQHLVVPKSQTGFKCPWFIVQH